MASITSCNNRTKIIKLLFIIKLLKFQSVLSQICEFPSTSQQRIFEVNDNVPLDSEILSVNYVPNDAVIGPIEIKGEPYFRGKFYWGTELNRGILTIFNNHSLILPSFPNPLPRMSLPVSVQCNGVTYPVGLINIVSMNSYAPTFYNQPYQIDIQENIPVQSTIDTSILAIDWDPAASYKINFTITGGNEEGYFSLEENRNYVHIPHTLPAGPHPLNDKPQRYSNQQFPRILTLRILKPLDYDSPNSPQAFKLRVTATDEGYSGSKKNSTFLFVRVTDSDDEVPRFTADKYVGKLPLSSAPGEIVTVTEPILAVDGDSFSIPVKYSFEQESQTEYFSIDEDTAEIRLIKELPEFVPPYFHLVLVATQENDELMQGIAYLQIEVSDLDGKRVLMLSPEQKLPFAPQQQEPQLSPRRFAFDPAESPYFDKCREEKSIEEHPRVGSSILQLSATHPTLGKNFLDNWKFVLVNSTDSQAFNLDPKTGILSAAPTNLLDREMQAQFRIEAKLVPVSDNLLDKNGTRILREVGDEDDVDEENGEDEQNGDDSCTTMSIVIRLLDINDHRPVFESKVYQFQIVDTIKKGDVVGLISASDKDAGLNGQIEYGDLEDIIGDVDNPVRFEKSVNSNGSVSIIIQYVSTGRPKFRPKYVRTLTAKDKAENNPKEATARIEILVEFSNAHQPSFEKEEYFAEIPENAYAGREVIVTPGKTVKAIDPDDGLGGEFKYILSSSEKGAFKIDGQSGVISVNDSSLIDYERTPIIVLTVSTVSALPRDNKTSSTDGIIGRRQAKVTVNIQDVNDNFPIFINTIPNVTEPVYRFYTNNDADLDQTIGRIEAVDEDEGPNGAIQFQALSIQPYFRFSDDGTITLARTFPASPQPVYSFVVRASNSGDQQRTATVEVFVSDVNVESPQFTNLPKTPIKVSEASPRGSPIFTFTLAPVDDSFIHLEIVSGNTNDSFGINEYSLFINSALDAEGIAEYELGIQLKNEQNVSANAVVQVKVEDANDNIPEFTQSAYDWTVNNLPNPAERKPYVLGYVEAYDADRTEINYQLQYYLADSDASALRNIIEVEPLTGKVILLTGPEFVEDVDDELIFTVKAVDAGKPPLQNVAIVRVSFENEERTPQFTQDEYGRDIDENEPPKAVIQIIATHPGIDGGGSGIASDVEGVMRYNLTPTYDKSLFHIDSESGVISTLQSLDYETAGEYQLKTEACFIPNDKARLIACNQVPFKLRVRDRNDNRPRFERDDYYFRIASTEPEGTVIGRVLAIDPDSGSLGDVSYALQTPTPYFTIQHDTGDILVSSVLDDAQMTNLTIEAYDHGRPSQSSTTVVQILINGSNPNAPAFQNFTYVVTVNEGLPVGSPIIKLTAVDPDPGPEGEVTYRFAEDELTQAMKMDFSLNPRSGEIILAKKLDYETTMEYNLVVEAVDGVLDRNLVRVGNTLVKIRVRNANEYKPEFQPLPSTLFMSTTKPVGSKILRVYGKDRDRQSNVSPVSFSLRRLDEGTDLFELTGNQLRVKRPLTEGNYKLTIVALDAGDPPLESTHDINVIVMANRDRYPVFPELSYDITLSRNQKLPKLLKTFQAVVREGRIEYEFFRKTPAGLSLDKDTGDLRAHTDLWTRNNPYESIFFVLRATNVEYPEYRSDIVVRVDISSNRILRTPLRFSGPLQRAELKENTPANTYINLTVNVEEPGIFQDKVTYYTYPNDTIYADSDGNIFVRKVIDLELNDDLDNEGVYSTTIYATNGTHRANTRLEVKILDENEYSPKFENPSTVVRVKEDIRGGDTIASVSAVDQDFSDHHFLRYKIKPGGASEYVTISDDGLLIKSDQPVFDREDAERMSVMIEAVDKAGNKAETEVIVELEDVNDQMPKFSQDIYSWDVTEGEKGVGSKLEVSATDDDSEGPNSQISFSILQGNNLGNFLLKPVGKTGRAEISIIKPLDREYRSTYIVTIEARDQGSPSMFSIATIEISVEDINDNGPVFGDKWVRDDMPGIPSDFPLDFTIVTLRADDPDEDAEIRYSIVEDYSSLFTVDPVRGEVKLTKRPNNVNFTYNVVLEAFDGEFRDNATVSIRVYVPPTGTNGNRVVIVNKAPVFQYDIYNFTVEEGEINSRIGQIKVRDPDNDSITLQIEPEDYRRKIAIYDNGTMMTKGGLEYKVNEGEMNFLVVATDNGEPAMNAYAKVRIRINDINDHPPAFAKPEYSALLPPNAVLDYPLQLDLDVTDEDAGLNAQLKYSLRGPDSNCFRINANSGQISLNCAPDFFKRPEYSVIIVATDGGGQGRESTARLSVLVSPPNQVIIDPGTGETSGGRQNGSNNFNNVCNITFDKPEKVLFVHEAMPIGTPIYQPNKFIHPPDGVDLNRCMEISISLQGGAADYFDVASASGLLVLKRPLNLSEMMRDGILDQANENVNEPEADMFTILFNITLPSTGETALQNLRFQLFPASINTAAGPGDVGNNRSGGNYYHHFNQQLYKFNVYENSPPNTSLGFLSPRRERNLSTNNFGAQQEQQQGRYQILGDNEHFALVGDEIRTTNRPLDYDEIRPEMFPDSRIQSFVVQFVPFSPEAAPQYATVLVAVHDLNDNAPVFNPNTRTVYEIPEAPYYGGSFLGRIEAVDADSGSNALVSYYIDDRSVPFHIDEMNGGLMVIGDIDREQQAFYQFNIIARDNGTNPMETWLKINVRVTDVNDHHPKFTITPQVLSVSEGTEVGTDLVTIKAADDDFDQFGSVLYSISPPSNYFSIHPKSGVIRLSKRLSAGQTERHVITVEAKDNGLPVNKAFLNVTFEVVPANQNQPVFKKDIEHVINLPSNVVINQPFYQVTAGPGPFIYGLKRDTNDMFSIDQVTGRIYINRQPLTNERGQTYPVTVIATNVTDSTSDQVTLKIRIEEVESVTRPPVNPGAGGGRVFDRAQYWVSVPENQPGRRRLVDLDSSYERQGRQVYYSFVAGSIDSFELNETSGELWAVKPLDRETRSLYILRVFASQQQQSLNRSARQTQRTIGLANIVEVEEAECLVVVNVTDINDHEPIFIHSLPIIFTIHPDAIKGQIIGKINVNDSDSKQPALSLKPSADANKFALDSFGHLRANVDFNNTREDKYDLTVIANDGSFQTNAPLVVYKLVSSRLAILVSGVPYDKVQKYKKSLEERLSQLTGWIVKVYSIFQHSDKYNKYDPKKKLESQLEQLRGPNGLRALSLESVRKAEVSRIGISMAELILIVISILIILSVLIGTCFIFKWWKRKEKDRVSSEYMVDSQSSGPRPYDVETLDRKTANAILVPHHGPYCQPPKSIINRYAVSPAPHENNNMMGEVMVGYGEVMNDVGSNGSNASVPSRRFLYYDNESYSSPSVHSPTHGVGSQSIYYGQYLQPYPHHPHQHPHIAHQHSPSNLSPSAAVLSSSQSPKLSMKFQEPPQHPHH